MNRSDAARYSKEGCLAVCIFLAVSVLPGCKCAETPAKPQTNQREEDLARLPQGAGSLEAQLAAEAAARPQGVPSLERLIAGLTDAGVSLGAPHQVMGQKQLATYCATADSLDGLIVTVCEYPSDEQAKRGEVEANVIASKIAGHQSRVRGKSVLHVVARSDTPQENVAKVLSTFDAL